MESVWTVDTLRGKDAWLQYTRENNGMQNHPIVNVTNQNENNNRVITFTGQSLKCDSNWTSVLQLSSAAQNYYSKTDAKKMSKDKSTYYNAPCQSQLCARKYGSGKIVVAGEAAFFTAQMAKIIFKPYEPDLTMKTLMINSLC